MKMVLSLIVKTLSQTDPDPGCGRIRKRCLTPFLPRAPLVRRASEDDQRSFFSLMSHDQYYDTNTRRTSVESVELFQSLPADMTEVESDPELRSLLRRDQGSDISSDSSTESRKTGLAPEAYYEQPSTTPARVFRMSRQNSKLSVNSRAPGYGSIDLNSEDDDEDFAHEPVTTASETRVFLKNTLPLILTFCLSQAYTILCTVTASKVFGTIQLSAVSLGSMTATISFSILEGISTALDVLNPQAYGAGNPGKVGVYTQRSVVFSLVVFLPLALFWWNLEPVFNMVLGDPELSALTASFLRTLVAGGPAYIIFENTKRYLQCQGIFNASTMVLLMTTPASVVLITILVKTIGFIGIAITCVANFWLMATLIVLYAWRKGSDDCWTGFTWDSFKGWAELVRFSFAGVICTFLEATSWELLTLFSSFFGTASLAAQLAVSTVASMTFFVPFAVGIASSTRVASFIGADRIDAAKIATKIGLIGGLVAGVLNALVLYFGRVHLAHMYSNDPEVIQLIVGVLPLVASIQLFDALNTVSGAMLRGQGSPYIGGVINFITYDFFAIPLAVFLGFHCGLKLEGLWIGIGLGLLLIGLSETYFVVRVDWHDAVIKCRERNRVKL